MVSTKTTKIEPPRNIMISQYTLRRSVTVLSLLLWQRRDKKFLCRLRSIAAHRDHFVRRLSVCPAVTHSYVSQVTRAFIGMLPLCCFLGWGHEITQTINVAKRDVKQLTISSYLNFSDYLLDDRVHIDFIYPFFSPQYTLVLVTFVKRIGWMNWMRILRRFYIFFSYVTTCPQEMDESSTKCQRLCLSFARLGDRVTGWHEDRWVGGSSLRVPLTVVKTYLGVTTSLSSGSVRQRPLGNSVWMHTDGSKIFNPSS